MMRPLHDPPAVTALLTCVGGMYAPATAQCLRAMDEPRVRVAGTDLRDGIENSVIFDRFEALSVDASGENLGEELLRVCEAAEADVVFPGSESECLAIVPLLDRFCDASVLVPMPDGGIIQAMTDKQAFYRLLNDHGLDRIEFVVAKGIPDVLHAIDELGYPSRGVVVKPQSGTGSRGTFVVLEKPPSPPIRNAERQYAMCTRGEFVELSEAWGLNGREHEYLVMHYYDGPVYDVDCLALDYNPVYVVPRERRYRDPLSPVNEGCMVRYDERVVDLIVRAIGEFELNYLFDFDAVVDEDGSPHIIDVSPRMSGSVAASAAAGVNIPGAVARHRAGLPVLETKVGEGTFLMPSPTFYSVPPLDL